MLFAVEVVRLTDLINDKNDSLDRSITIDYFYLEIS